MDIRLVQGVYVVLGLCIVNKLRRIDPFEVLLDVGLAVAVLVLWSVGSILCIEAEAKFAFVGHTVAITVRRRGPRRSYTNGVVAAGPPRPSGSRRLLLGFELLRTGRRAARKKRRFFASFS